ncbi:MAG: PTS sugar transporter subunit IIB [Spirochaetia bacterium]|jgi:galactitol PTS system EIIB component|nr:PTS sugar transporter subunit IIB [Spirochaetia bacterium]
MAKKILVACGTAVATSTVVLRKIDERLEEKGIKVNFVQCKASEVPSKLDGVDLIVTTTPVNNVGDIPVIQTLSFITGLGIDADMEKILSYIKE